jgi:ligand-binding SRPBCC domain-containing protein
LRQANSSFPSSTVIHRLHRQQFIPAAPAIVWDFFATPRNLDVLTPPRVRFQIVGEIAPRMFAGQVIEYRIGLLPGVWTRWLTEITHVREGEYFVDDQRIGPYRLWHHEHHFTPAPGGVTMTDHVTFDVGWGPAGWLAERLWVAREVETIFDFRARKIAELFPGPRA